VRLVAGSESGVAPAASLTQAATVAPATGRLAQIGWAVRRSRAPSKAAAPGDPNAPEPGPVNMVPRSEGMSGRSFVGWEAVGSGPSKPQYHDVESPMTGNR
jgi:hypothetical protein